MQKSISSCIVPLRFGRIATETKKVPEIIPAHFLACMVNKITFFLALHACTHTWILLDFIILCPAFDKLFIFKNEREYRNAICQG